MTTPRSVIQTIRGIPASDGAGVKLTRIIGQPALDMLDPFLLLDEFGSDQAQDYIAGFPDHPHRGFETVTYMLEGNMRHGDNQGNSGHLSAGSVQWMTAGRGIVHSEMPEQEEGRMRGFQLWVNLPASDKMCEPRYQDIPPEEIPEVGLGEGVRARLVAGELGDVAGPVKAVATEPVYVDFMLDRGAAYDLALPHDHTAFAYVFEGEARIGAADTTVKQGQLVVLGPGDAVPIAAAVSGTRVLVVAGRPLGEPVARYGPFVMNTEAELRQAFEDYRAGDL